MKRIIEDTKKNRRCSEKISKRLFQAQGLIGISRADLHKNTKLSYSTIDKVLAGYLGCSIICLKIVADELNVPMKELF